ncbi:MAG: M20 aminoacylase family protein [Geminicoccaceae bacterium]
MAIINRIADFHDEMTAWRQDFHAHPELGFKETRTSAIVAEKLKAFGFDEVHTDIAKTGVVGVLRAGNGSDAGGETIGLRADMDALPINETTGKPYASTNPGCMHACGHDGHTTMLLGAARYLAETRNFNGTVYFIFQPAEEGEGGGRVMVEEGLFERFPMRHVYGMHNWPGRPVGNFAMRPGPIMAATDQFLIEVKGKGGHAAAPHFCLDPLVTAAEIALAMQTIVSRNVDPVGNGVVSVTQLHAGDAYNVIPETAFLTGTARSFTPEVRNLLEERISAIPGHIAKAHMIEADVKFMRGYPATVNTEAETDLAADTAAEIAGEDKVDRETPPVMGGEDFAYMLEKKPGSYIFIGNGGDEDTPMLHNPGYDFNDETLPHGASYWARLVERLMPAA